MDFMLNQEQQQIRDEVLKLCAQFDDAYWLEKDRSGTFPHELHAALAQAGWLASPCRRNMAGPISNQAAVMMQAVAESGAAMSGASAVHINIFGRALSSSAPTSRSADAPPLIAVRTRPASP
jgi:acyl-CoA dehydrogenase